MGIADNIKKIQKSRLKLFEVQDIKKLLEIKKDNTAYKVISSLIKNEVIIKVRKGLYYTAVKPPADFEIANKIYSPSYVSLESALNIYGILRQFPYSVTSVTFKKPRRFTSSGKVYEYARVDRSLYFGFTKKDVFLIAYPEKALIDAIYLTAKGFRKFNFDELDYSKIDKKKFQRWCAKIKHRPFMNLLKRIKI